MATWNASLPTKFVQGSYVAVMDNITKSFQPAVGPPTTWATATAAGTTHRGTYEMTRAQFDQFIADWRDSNELNHGIPEITNMPHPALDGVTFRGRIVGQSLQWRPAPGSADGGHIHLDITIYEFPS